MAYITSSNIYCIARSCILQWPGKLSEEKDRVIADQEQVLSGLRWDIDALKNERKSLHEALNEARNEIRFGRVTS